MTTPASDIASILRLQTKIQRDLAQLSLGNQRVLLTALLESLADERESTGATSERPDKPGQRKTSRKRTSSPPRPVRRGGRPMVPGSGRELTLSAVLASPKPLSAAEAVAAVKRRDPKVKARAVYGALHEFAQKGRISSEMKGKKAVYFKPKG